MSFADVAKAVFELSGRSADDVSPVEHRGVLRRQGRLAPRPLRSVMDLTKMRGDRLRAGGRPTALERYVEESVRDA